MNNIGNGDENRQLPPMPSMTSPNAISQLPPRHRIVVQSNHTGSSRDQTNDSSGDKTNRSSNSNSTTQSPHSLGSRIKISSTLGLLILGLILSVCILGRYAIMGPSPPLIRSDDNNQDSANEGGSKLSEESTDKQKSRREKAKELFDESGRYIIEDYDALPTFSNFLPVR